MTDHQEELIDRYLRNECNDAEMATFRDLLENNNEFGETFVRRTTEVAQIIEVAEDLAANSSGQTAPKTAEARSTDPNASKQPLKWPIMLALVAMAALAFIILPRPDAQPIATLTQSVAATWPTGVNHPLGANLSRGSFSIDKGFAELAFNSGPRIILEGPATLELINDNRARLVSGRLVARMPEGVSGFRIDSPDAQAVDLGTEFGMVVNEKSGTEIHVIDGIVDVNAGDGQTATRLETNDAISVTNSQKAKLAADPAAFMRILPAPAPIVPPYVHWSFDDVDGSIVPDLGSGIDGQPFDARLATAEKGALPQFSDGMIQQGLQFDGKGSFVATDFPGVSKGNSRTVAFWVKVPANATPKHAYAMLSWGSFEHYGATWQISWNSEPKHGPLGRLRAGVHGGQVIGTQDLRDGRWHHVAIVLFGSELADVATHVLLYVDGELEQTSRKAVQAVKTDTGPEAKTVHLGRNAGFDHKNRFFRGAIDDVVISTEALSQDQIRQIMKSGGATLKQSN